jgi:Tol biopolymer transport system component
LLFEAEQGVFVFGPAWSPDGSTIAYVSRATEFPGRFAVWSIDANGGDPRELVPLGDEQIAEVSGLVWSPDGSSLALAINPSGPDRTAGRIAVVDLAAATMRFITEGHDDWAPRWSPDGERIAFIRRVGMIMTAAADGSDIRFVPGAHTSDFGFAWHPVEPATGS